MVPQGFVRAPATSSLSRLLSLPEASVRRIVGAPIVIDGRTLDPSVQLLLRIADRMLPLAGDRTDPVRRRRAFRRTAALAMPRATGVHVVDRLIPGPDGWIPVRIYRSLAAAPQPPAVVYLHGGGWVVGDLDTHDGSARMLARESGAVVVAVHYRRAPEHRFPAAVEDAVAAFRWVLGNARMLRIDPAAVAVMGDSAGGNLAAAVCIAERDAGRPLPAAQGLLYPCTDARRGSALVPELASGFLLTVGDVAWFIDQYLPDPADQLSALASPGLVADLSGLPPARIWTAGFDPLRGQGSAHADRLAAAGVPVGHRCLDDQVHGFFGMGVLPGGIDRIRGVCREMGQLLERGRS